MTTINHRRFGPHPRLAAAACRRGRARTLRRVAAGGVRSSSSVRLVVVRRLRRRPITGQAILSNYPGWMGKNNLAAFHAKYPDASIKMISNATSSSRRGGAAVQEQAVRLPALGHHRLRPGRRRRPDHQDRLDEGAEHQEHRAEVPQGVPVGPAHRLRQGRHRLPPRPVGNATIDQLARPLGADPAGTPARPYSSTSSATAWVRPASTSASRPTPPTRTRCSKVQDAITSVKPHLKAFLNTDVGARPGQRLDGDGDGLGLRRGAAAAEERQDQVGAARGGRARLPRGLHRRAGHRPRST